MNSTFLKYLFKCCLPVYKCIVLTFISEDLQIIIFFYAKMQFKVYTEDKTHSFMCVQVRICQLNIILWSRGGRGLKYYVCQGFQIRLIRPWGENLLILWLMATYSYSRFTEETLSFYFLHVFFSINHVLGAPPVAQR